MDLSIKQKSTKAPGKRQKKEPIQHDKDVILDDTSVANIPIKTEFMDTEEHSVTETHYVVEEEKRSDRPMRAYYSTEFDTPTPLPGLAIVFANSMDEAVKILDGKLLDAGLRPSTEKAYNLIPLDISRSSAYILSNGRDLMKWFYLHE